jgi:hypothetical protein
MPLAEAELPCARGGRAVTTQFVEDGVVSIVGLSHGKHRLADFELYVWGTCRHVLPGLALLASTVYASRMVQDPRLTARTGPVGKMLL